MQHSTAQTVPKKWSRAGSYVVMVPSSEISTTYPFRTERLIPVIYFNLNYQRNRTIQADLTSIGGDVKLVRQSTYRLICFLLLWWISTSSTSKLRDPEI